MGKKILFITKNYPPQVGGMENYCRDLVAYLRNSGNSVFLIANSRGLIRLPWFGIKSLFLGLYYAFRADVIWIGDAAISPIGYLLSLLSGKKRCVTVHALDITRNKSLYQKIIPWIVAKSDHVVAVSHYTKEQCEQRGIPSGIINIIPNGINPQIMNDTTIEKTDLCARFGILLVGQKKILFSVCRHIERKGIQRFLDQVMPNLGDEYIYIIAGKGPMTGTYKNIVREKNLKNVYIIGRPSDEEKIALYKHSDLFIVPNIHVPGDAEGFGIVCIEAGRYGLPTLASNREGIKDAVIQGKTGYLIQDDPQMRLQAIRDAKFDRSQVAEQTSLHYNRQNLIQQYLKICS